MVYEIAEHASCPVINALCNMEHPCQVMADLTTIIEHKGGLDGVKVAFVGDGNNNVTHSLALACAMLGMDVSVAAPATDFMAKEFSDKCASAALISSLSCAPLPLFLFFSFFIFSFLLFFFISLLCQYVCANERESLLSCH